MTTLHVDHVGQDRYRIAIRGHSVVVDQPLSAGGDDQGPTPTELFVGSLAACVGFYVGRFLRRHASAEDSFAVESEFLMSETAPARVAAIDLRVVLKNEVQDELRAAVLRAAQHCTVHNSLTEPPAIRIEVIAPVPETEGVDSLTTLPA